MCHVVPVLKPMSDFELEFNDRLQYWHGLQGEVVRIMKRSSVGASRSKLRIVRRQTGDWKYVTQFPSLSVLA